MAISIETLKAFGTDLNPHGSVFQILDQWCEDKHLDPRILKNLAISGTLGLMFQNSLKSNPADTVILNYYGKMPPEHPNGKFEEYAGHPKQNKRIDQALRQRVISGIFKSAALIFTPQSLNLPKRVKQVRILVLGAGPVGAIVSNALSKAGFENIAVFEKSPEAGGIWNRPEVSQSKNNPKPFTYSEFSVKAAPGDGSEILNLARITNPGYKQLTVEKVFPKDLSHVVKFEKVEDSAPIVINCLGTGKPKNPADREKMTTTATTTQCGQRWQSILRPPDKKQFLFVGLGNSTAEMILQIEKQKTEGLEIDYKILTHYPEDAVRNPWDAVDQRGKVFQVFRDLDAPNLTKLAGDLDQIRRAYFLALNHGRIISNVKSWDPAITGVKMVRYEKSIKEVRHFSHDGDARYVLIGYGRTPQEYAAMGIDVRYGDFERGSFGRFLYGDPIVDYDGEFRRANGTPIKGYFGMGPIIETSVDRNAVVLPGVLFRLGDLIASVVARAAESVKL